MAVFLFLMIMLTRLKSGFNIRMICSWRRAKRVNRAISLIHVFQIAHVHTALLVLVTLFIMRVILLLNNIHRHLSLKLRMVDLFLAAITELQYWYDSGDGQGMKRVAIFYNLFACFFLDVLVNLSSLQSFCCRLPTLVQLSKGGEAVLSPSYILI